MDWGFENLRKIDPKCDQKLDASWDGFGEPLGSIFDGFWEPRWSQVGAKLALKSVQDRYKSNLRCKNALKEPLAASTKHKDSTSCTKKRKKDG